MTQPETSLTRCDNGLFLGVDWPKVSPLEIAKTFYKTPSLHAYRVRCGKPTCHCATGERHGPYWYLHWREGTYQRRRYVRQGEVEAVRAIIDERRHEARLWREAMAMAMARLREVNQWLRERRQQR